MHKLKHLDSLKISLCTKVTTNIAVKNINCRTREVSFRAKNTPYEYTVRCIRPTSEQAQNRKTIVIGARQIRHPRLSS